MRQGTQIHNRRRAWLSVTSLCLIFYTLLNGGMPGLTPPRSWASSSVSALHVLLDTASGRIDAHDQAVHQALAAIEKLDSGDPMWPVYAFLRGEAYRLQHQPESARQAYQTLVTWGAHDPYGDGWGGSSLINLALWRWLQMMQSDRPPCQNGARSCGSQAPTPLNHQDVQQLLNMADAIRQMRLPQGLFTVSAFCGLPQLEADIVRRLALLAWRIGQSDRATELFLDYLTLTDRAPAGVDEERLLNRVFRSGLATPGRLSLLQGKRLKSMGWRAEARLAFHQALDSQDAQVRAEARLHLAELLPESARSEAMTSLTSVIKTAANPHVVQQALLSRGRHFKRMGSDRDLQRFAGDLKRLIETFPRGRYTEEALYDLAHHFQTMGDFDQARHYFQKLQTAQGTVEWSQAAALQAALALYARGQSSDIATAIEDLEASARHHPFGPLRFNRLFWLGRLYAAQGNSKRAKYYFDQLIAERPFSYHGIRARMHMHLGPPAPRELWPGPLTRKAILTAYQNSTSPSELSRVSPYHARLQVALESGLYATVFATDRDLLTIFPSQRPTRIPLSELDRTLKLAPLGIWLALRQDALAASDVRTAASHRLQLAGIVGRWGGDWPLALTLLHNPLLAYKPQDNIQHDRQYLAVAYPAVFQKAISRSSQAHTVPGALLYGMARQNSLLYSAARSSSGALGVLQFLPGTFARFNQRWRLFDASSAATSAEYLLDPNLSLDLGALWFSEELLPRRQGHILLALMEYHAGTTAVDAWQAGWRRQKRLHDIEYMIETIPNPSTQQYVQRVLTDMMIAYASDLFPPHRKVSRASHVTPSTQLSRDLQRQRYRVALLPTYVTEPRRIYHAEHRAVQLLKETVRASDALELVFVSHDDEHMKQAKTKHISRRMLNKVWRRGKPKFDLVYQIGEQLGVDIVVLYGFDITSILDRMSIYVVNVRERKAHTQSVYTEGCFTDGDGYFEELDLTRKMFSESMEAMN